MLFWAMSFAGEGPTSKLPQPHASVMAREILAWVRPVLHKKELHAFQISKRGGELFCVHVGDRVKISGKAVLYLQGVITI